MVYQVEFVTSGVVRLYLDGRDIRSELGGAKSASTTSTPKKYFDIQSKPKDSSSVQEDMSELVSEVIENVVDSTEKSEEIENTVESMEKSEEKQETTDQSEVIPVEEINVVKEGENALGTTETKQEIAKGVSDLVGEIVEDVLNQQTGPEHVKEQESDIVSDSDNVGHDVQETEDKNASDKLNGRATEAQETAVKGEDVDIEEKQQTVASEHEVKKHFKIENDNRTAASEHEVNEDSKIEDKKKTVDSEHEVTGKDLELGDIKEQILDIELNEEDFKIEGKKEVVDSGHEGIPKVAEKQMNGVCGEVDMKMVTETLEEIVRAAVIGK